MQDPDIDAVPAGELAWCEAELPEWDRLRVRDYWDAVVTGELGAPEPSASLFECSELGVRHAGAATPLPAREADAVLRLVVAAVEEPDAQEGEAA